MNIPGIPDLKTPLLWALSLALIAALAGLGWQRVQLAEVRQDLAVEKSARASENAKRATAAAKDEKQVAQAEHDHSTTQQGIADDLAKARQDLAVARAGRADLDGRLRDTAARLASASAQLQAQADATAPGSCEHQRGAELGLLAEAGSLLAEGRSLAREGGDIIAGRDAEVKALKAQVLADRKLMEDAAAPPQQTE